MNNKPRRHIHNLAEHSESYVKTSDLADYWMVSRKQIYKQIEAGTLKAIRLGPRLLRVSTAEAIEFEKQAKMVPPSDHHHYASSHADVDGQSNGYAQLSAKVLGSGHGDEDRGSDARPRARDGIAVAADRRREGAGARTRNRDKRRR